MKNGHKIIVSLLIILTILFFIAVSELTTPKYSMSAEVYGMSEENFGDIMNKRFSSYTAAVAAATKKMNINDQPVLKVKKHPPIYYDRLKIYPTYSAYKSFDRRGGISLKPLDSDQVAIAPYLVIKENRYYRLYFIVEQNMSFPDYGVKLTTQYGDFNYRFSQSSREKKVGYYTADTFKPYNIRVDIKSEVY